MKECSYCGAEYPDDATVCAIDQTPLEQPHSENLAQIPLVTNGHLEHETTNLTYPDYQWSARDAWKCLGMLLVFQFVSTLVFSAIDWHIYGFYSWREHSGLGRFLMAVLYYAIGLLTAAYFARTETLASFWKGLGLDRKPSDYVWYGVVMALIIRFFGHFAIMHGWGKGVSNFDFNAFIKTADHERYLYLVPPLLLAPLCEEAINRGFIYKAFRSTYSMKVSIALILAWTAYAHWGQYRQSYLAAFDLSMLTIVQCYLREKSDSLWDCILCHFAFNASTFFVGNIFH
jgi:membrane protease YdiL (CAAX protease family)